MVALRSNYGDVFGSETLSTGQLSMLDGLVYDEYDKVPNHIPELFNIRSSGNWGEQSVTYAGLPLAPEKAEGEDPAFEDPIEGYDKTYVHITYALAVAFSKEITEDNRMSFKEDTLRSLGKSMAQTEQIVAFNIFNNGFTDTGPDGSSLFNATHTMIAGHTYGNRPSVDIALSKAGLKEMDVDVLRQVDHANINVALQIKTLLVPPELRQTAKELMGSEYEIGTGNNTKNIYSGAYNVVVSPFLTSTTAWFGLADPMDHQIRFYDRVAPEVTSWVTDGRGDENHMIRRRFSVGYSDWIGSWGTTG